MANERLRALEDVEKEIAMILQCAGKKALFYLHYIYSINNEAYAVQWHSCIQILLGCTGCFPEWHFPVNYLRYLFWFKIIFAGNIVLELSKDKHNASLLDRQLGQFQSSVNKVESELSTQIRYLTQVNTDLYFYVVHCITTHNLLCPIKTICSCTQTRVSH